MENIVFLILLLGLGKLSRLLPAFPENTPTVLNQFVIYISLPATILYKLNGLEIRPELLMLVVIPWTLILFSILSVRITAGALGWNRRLTGGVMLCAALGNTSFFGFPAISVFLDPEFLSYAVIYDQLGSFLAVATFGTITVAVYGGTGKVRVRQILQRIMVFPPFIAMVIGAMCINVTYPAMVTSILDSLAATLVPVVTFAVGAALVFRQPAANMIPIGITMTLKMIVSPMIAFLILWAVNIRGPVFYVGVFEAAMPPMVMAGVMAAAGNMRADVANAAIGYGILFSFVTLPLIRFLFQFY